MAESIAQTPDAGPRLEYQQRLARFRAELAASEKQLAWVGNLRFFLFIFGFISIWLSLGPGLFSPIWLAVLLVVFLALAIPFERARRRGIRATRGIAYYDAGLARLDDRWAGKGPDGRQYLDEEHLYAADLDLFGAGSLFQLLCCARTRIGRDTLADWLRVPAKLEEIRERQGAIPDLKTRISFREDWALLGSDIPEGIETGPLATWGLAHRAATMPSLWPRWLALGIVAFNLLTLTGWLLDQTPLFLWLGAVLLQLGFAGILRPRVQAALEGLDGRSRDLLILTDLLTCLERESFAAPRLVQLHESLRNAGELPSSRLRDLGGLVAMIDSTHNAFFAMLAPFVLWTTRVALSLETWRWRTGPALQRWLTAIGEVEALNSLAAYAYENPADPLPELTADGPVLTATGLRHPLLPRAASIANDIDLNPHHRLLLVSGSNMSGKSTFLRTVGVNAVLALAGGPVRAERMRISPLNLGATLRIQDSLQAGKSRFYAEITRLRQIVEKARTAPPLLFLLDEILHGTNSHDRRIGAEAVVRTLLQCSSLGMVTTHDLALTKLADELAPLAANVHFEDQLIDGKLNFDYRLHEGVVKHSNALALMRAVGLTVADNG